MCLCSPECPELVATNGIFSYTNQRLIGSVATLTCIEGYEAVNSSATCLGGTTWSSSPMCDCECNYFSYVHKYCMYSFMQ